MVGTSRRLTVDKHSTCCNGIRIVFDGAIAKLIGENLEDFASSPSLLAPCVVRVVIGRDSSQTALEVVGSRPRVAGCDDDVRWFFHGVWFRRRLDTLLDGGQGHGCWQFSAPRQERYDSGGGSHV